MSEPDSAAPSGLSLPSTPSTQPADFGRDRHGGAAAAAIEVIICSGFPTQIALALLLTGLGLPTIDRAGQLSFAHVITLSLADVALVLGLITYFLHARGESLRALVGFGPNAGREARLGLLLVPLFVVAAMGGLLLIGALAPSLRNVPENPLQGMLSTPARAAAFGLVAVTAGGIREELQRAFVLRRFEQSLGGGWLGLVVFSLAFGLGHHVQGWDATLMTGALGAVWGAMMLIRRSAIAPMVCHAGFNLVEILLFLAATGSPGGQ